MSERHEIEDELALREASIADARREFAAGELSDAALAAILAREYAAIESLAERAATLREPESEPVAAVPTVRVRRRRWLLVAALAFALALAVVLWSAVQPRQAGTSITGSVTLGRAAQITQLLTEAEADVANANDVAALAAYAQVLALDPRNVVALSQSGWLDFSAASAAKDATLVARATSMLRRAITLAPRDPGARLYYALAASDTPGNALLATSEWRVFLTLNPSPAQRAVAAPYLARYKLGG